MRPGPGNNFLTSGVLSFLAAAVAAALSFFGHHLRAAFLFFQLASRHAAVRRDGWVTL